MKKSQLNQVTNKPRTQADFIALGGLLAHALIGADNQAFNVKRDTLLSMAQAHSGDVDAVKHILEGVATKYISEGYTENIAKARKSEAKAVFEAVAKTLLTGDNVQLLKDFIGGYHDFIKYARELRDVGKESKETTGEGEQTTKPLSDIQLADIQDKLKRLDVNQTIGFTNQLANQVPQYSDNQALTGLRQFGLIANITDAMLNNEHFDEYTIKLATELNSKVLEGIATITKALQDAQQATDAMEATPYDVAVA